MSTEQISREEILRIVYESVDDLNAQLGSDQQIERAPETSLLIGRGGLDSLGFINLITAIEEKCEERFDRFVALVGGDSGESAYESIGELVDYIAGKLGDRAPKSR